MDWMLQLNYISDKIPVEAAPLSVGLDRLQVGKSGLNKL